MKKTRRWFLDTEFNEDGKTIELISLALVAEDGSFLYAVSNEFDPEKCNDWVKANVLPKLPPRTSAFWMSRADIADAVKLALIHEAEKPEIWGYFADYDWVVLCQLYGPMVALPKGMPFFCRDLKQEMDRLGVKKDQMPPEAKANEHDALADARWIREGWLYIRSVVGARGADHPEMTAPRA